MRERIGYGIDNILDRWMEWIEVSMRLRMRSRIGRVRCCLVFVLYAVDHGRGLLVPVCKPGRKLEGLSVNDGFVKRGEEIKVFP